MILYIGDEIVDLYPKALIFYTVQRLDVGNLSGRSVNVSNSFTAPWTENNERLFGFAKHEKSKTSLTYTLRQCKMVNDGVEIAVNNVLYITKTVNKEFSLQIFEDIFDWFQSVIDKNIADLEPIDDSAWNASDMDAARLSTDGLVSALIFWANNIVFSELNFLPSFYYHTLINKILEFTGLSVSGNILTDARFTDLIVPFASPKFEYPESYYSQFRFYNPRTSDQNVVGAIDSETVVFGQNVSIYTHGTYFARVSVGGITWGTGTNLILRLRVNGDLVASYYMTSPVAPGVSVEVQYKGFFNPGDIVNFYIYSDAMAGPGISYTIVGSFVSTYMTFTPDGIINRGLVNWNVLLPKISCSDLLKDFFNRFGIVPKQVNNQLIFKTISEIIEDVGGAVDWSLKLVNPKNKAIDFKTTYAQQNKFAYQDRVDDSDLGAGSIDIENTTLPISKTLFTSIFGNSNTVRYFNWTAGSIPIFDPNREEDTGDFTAGRTVVAADDIDQTDENTIVYLLSAVPFNFTIDVLNTDTTVMLKNIGTDIVTLIEGAGITLPDGAFDIPPGFYVILVYRNTGLPDIYLFETVLTIETNEDPGLRLMTLKDRTVEDSVTFDAIPRTDYRIGYFVDEDEDKDTGFQYFIDQFYATLEASLQKNKILTKFYLLTENDIKSSDPHKMIYDGDGYYLVNKIVNFYPGRVTKVELFKLM